MRLDCSPSAPTGAGLQLRSIIMFGFWISRLMNIVIIFLLIGSGCSVSLATARGRLTREGLRRTGGKLFRITQTRTSTVLRPPSSRHDATLIWLSLCSREWQEAELEKNILSPIAAVMSHHQEPPPTVIGPWCLPALKRDMRCPRLQKKEAVDFLFAVVFGIHTSWRGDRRRGVSPHCAVKSRSIDVFTISLFVYFLSTRMHKRFLMVGE